MCCVGLVFSARALAALPQLARLEQSGVQGGGSARLALVNLGETPMDATPSEVVGAAAGDGEKGACLERERGLAWCF